MLSPDFLPPSVVYFSWPVTGIFLGFFQTYVYSFINILILILCSCHMSSFENDLKGKKTGNFCCFGALLGVLAIEFP